MDSECSLKLPVLEAFCHFQSVASGYQLDAMANIDEIRRINLEALATEVGGNKALADLIGISESQMGQWRRGLKNSSTGKRRGLRLASCHRIEDATGKPRGWLDIDHNGQANLAAAPPTLADALEVLGIALATEMPDEVRQDAADILAKLAQRKGLARHQAELLTLLNAPRRKQALSA